MHIQPFRDMIGGMRIDLVKSRYKTFDELYEYMYRQVPYPTYMSYTYPANLCDNFLVVNEVMQTASRACKIQVSSPAPQTELFFRLYF